MTNSGMQEAVNQGMQGAAAAAQGDFASAASHYAEAADLYAKYFILQTGAAVRLRALGYFLEKRHGIDPATLDYGDSV